MKRLLFLVLLMTGLSASAQNLQLHYDEWSLFSN